MDSLKRNVVQQVKLTPPITGPTTPPMPTITTDIDKSWGRIAGGAAALIMTMPPLKRPAAPIPAIDLPTMNPSLVFESALTSVPKAKVPMKETKVA